MSIARPNSCMSSLPADQQQASSRMQLRTSKTASRRRRSFRTGNFELTGTHFTWIDDALIPEESQPEWAVVVERFGDFDRAGVGRFYGTPTAFLLDGEPVAERPPPKSGTSSSSTTTRVRRAPRPAASAGEARARRHSPANSKSATPRRPSKPSSTTAWIPPQHRAAQKRSRPKSSSELRERAKTEISRDACSGSTRRTLAIALRFDDRRRAGEGTLPWPTSSAPIRPTSSRCPTSSASTSRAGASSCPTTRARPTAKAACSRRSSAPSP